MRLSLLIGGDASGAVKASKDTAVAIDTVAASGRAADQVLQGLDARVASSLRGAAVSANVSGQAFKLNAFQMQNMAFQMNDMATMLASGQSPFVMLMQQGMQISQIFGPGVGVQAALKGVGAALISFVTNPLNLAVLGFAVAGGAAGAFFNLIKNGGGSAEDVLKRHDAAINAIKNAWSGARGEAARYSEAVQTKVEAQRHDDVDRLQRLLQGQLQQAASFLSANPRDMAVTGGISISDAYAREFGAAGVAVEKFVNDTRAGKGDVTALNDEVQRLARMEPANRGLQDLRQHLDSVTSGAADTVAKLRETNAEAAKILVQLGGMDYGAYQRLAGGYSARATIDQAQREQRAALLGVGARSPAERAAAAGAAVLAQPLDTVNDPTGAVRQYQAEAAAALTLAQAMKGVGEAQRDRVRSYSDAVSSARLDLDLIGKTTGEVTRLRMEYQLTAQLKAEAAKNGIAVDQAELDLIRQTSTAAGELATKLASASLRDNLSFDRAQLGRSGIDQTIASTLRGAGLSVDFGSVEAGMIRVNEQLKLGHDLVLDFASGFRNDLKNGVSVIDAIGNALGRLEDKLLDLALNQGINTLFSAIGGAFGIGGSPLAGGLALGQGGIGHHRAGGYIDGPGTGTSDSIHAMVSKGEFITNAAATARHRPILEAINDNRAIPLYADGGYVGRPALGSGSSDRRWTLEIVNEAGVTVRDGGARGNDSGGGIQRLIIGAAIDDLQSGGPLSSALQGTFSGLRRAVR
jgi:hypothetical protein